MALSVSVTVGAPASDAIRTSSPPLMNPTRLAVRARRTGSRRLRCRRSAWRRAGRAAGARGGCRPRRARCTPAPGRRGESAIRAPPVGERRLQRLVRPEREAELAQERRRRRAGASPRAPRPSRRPAPRRAPARAAPGRRRGSAPVGAPRRCRGRGSRRGRRVGLVLERVGELGGGGEPVGRAASRARSAPPPRRGAGWCGAGAASGRGLSVTTRATTACAVAPVNGGSPVSISYSTAPSA